MMAEEAAAPTPDERDAPGTDADQHGDPKESMLVKARRGVAELALVARNLIGDPESLDDVGGHRKLLLGLGALLVLIGGGAIALFAFAPLDAEQFENGRRLLRLVLHPVVLPATVLGLYLRRNMAFESGRRRRALDRGRAESLWDDVAPQLLAIYLVAAVAVTLLTVARLQGSGFDVAEVVDDASRYLIICVWVLAPIAYAHRPQDALGTMIQAGFGAFMSILFMRLTLKIASWGINLIGGIVGSLLPVPEVSIDAVTAVGAVFAGLAFLAYMLGYTFMREREHFVAWAVGDDPQPDEEAWTL